MLLPCHFDFSPASSHPFTSVPHLSFPVALRSQSIDTQNWVRKRVSAQLLPASVLRKRMIDQLDCPLFLGGGEEGGRLRLSQIVEKSEGTILRV